MSIPVPTGHDSDNHDSAHSKLMQSSFSFHRLQLGSRSAGHVLLISIQLASDICAVCQCLDSGCLDSDCANQEMLMLLLIFSLWAQHSESIFVISHLKYSRIVLHGSKSGSGLKMKSEHLKMFRFPCIELRGGFSSHDVPSTERQSLAAFRSLIAGNYQSERSINPDLFTDERLMRFLRNNDLDHEKAFNAFHRMIQRRKDLQADEIWRTVKSNWKENFWEMPCIPKRETFREFYHFEPAVCVKDGELVSLEHTGQIRIRDFMSKITEAEILTFFCFLMEWSMIKLTQLSRKTKKLSRMIQIKNLEGISLFQASSKKGMDLFSKLNKMLHDVYPETLSRLVVVHAPPIFGIIWRMFRAIIPKRTRKKMEVYSSHEKSSSVLCKLTGQSQWRIGDVRAPSESKLQRSFWGWLTSSKT